MLRIVGKSSFARAIRSRSLVQSDSLFEKRCRTGSIAISSSDQLYRSGLMEELEITPKDFEDAL